jgi:hypothetical protein
MNSEEDSNDKRKKEGRDRAVVLRHDARKAGLINPRVWLTPAGVPEFFRLIAPLGPHVLGPAAALAHLGLRPLGRRPAARKPKDATPPSGPAAESKPADASQVMKAEPAAPPATAAATKPADAPQPPKPETENPRDPLPLFPDYQP